MTTEKSTTYNTYPKVAVQWLNHPESYRDCASIKVCAWFTAKCLTRRGRRQPSGSCKTLPARLNNNIARMNYRSKHKVTGQMNHQKADPNAKSTVFLFFSTAHFLKTILAMRTNGTFGFSRNTSQRFSNSNEPIFANESIKLVTI